MTAPIIGGMSPLKLNSTVLAIAELGFSPDILDNNVRHSGNEFASVGAIVSARPAFRCRTPLLAAYSLIGLKGLQVTVCDITFATFAAGLRLATSSHSKLALNSGAKAMVYIDGASVDANGILMADLLGVLLSSDGLTLPFADLAGSAALPTLSSEPQLHTLGPFAMGAGPTRYDGNTNQGFRQGHIIAAPIHDGDKFPKTCSILGMDPQIMATHEDPITLLAALGLMGKAIPTQAIAYFRGIDPTTQQLQTTGLTIAMSSGYAMPMPVQFDLSKPARMGYGVRPLSSTGTHPFTISTAAAVA